MQRPTSAGAQNHRVSRDDLPASLTVVDPRSGIAHPGNEWLTADRAFQRSHEPGDAGCSSGEYPQLQLVDAIQHLVATGMPAEVVLLRVEVAVRAGEDHIIIKQRGQRLGRSARARCPGRPTSGRPGHRDQAMSNRSRFMTLSHAATKSCTNFPPESSLAAPPARA